MLTVRPPIPGALFDAGRLFLEELTRNAIPPESPEILRAASGASWRMVKVLKPMRHAVMVDELRRSFRMNVRTAESAAREAQDVGLQSRLEKMLSPQITDFAPYIRIEGHFPEGSLLVTPSVSTIPLFHAALAARYPGLVVFRQRGLPENGMGPLKDTRINRYALYKRQSYDARLPILWESDPEALGEALREGRRVVVAFDDRAWKNWQIMPFLGRQSLLSPDLWVLAQQVGARVFPAVVWRERDKSCKAIIGGEIAPDLERYVRGSAEPWLASWPGQYAMWLAECRMNAALDDHPFFVDYAPDGRWRKWG